MRMSLSRLPAVAVAMAMATLLLCALIAVGSIGTTVVAAQQQSPSSSSSSSSPPPSRAQSKIDSLKLAIIDDLPSRSSVYEEESPLAAHAAAFVSLASGAAPCEVCIYFMSQTNHTAGTCSSTTPPLTDADKATCARVAQAASQSALMAVESGGCTQKQEGGNTMLIQPCPAHILCTFIDFCPRDKDFPLPASLVATTSTTPTTTTTTTTTKALVESSSEVTSHLEASATNLPISITGPHGPYGNLYGADTPHCGICKQIMAMSANRRRRELVCDALLDPVMKKYCEEVLHALLLTPGLPTGDGDSCFQVISGVTREMKPCTPLALCGWLPGYGLPHNAPTMCRTDFTYFKTLAEGPTNPLPSMKDLFPLPSSTGVKSLIVPAMPSMVVGLDAPMAPPMAPPADMPPVPPPMDMPPGFLESHASSKAAQRMRARSLIQKSAEARALASGTEDECRMCQRVLSVASERRTLPLVCGPILDPYERRRCELVFQSLPVWTATLAQAETNGCYQNSNGVASLVKPCPVEKMCSWMPMPSQPAVIGGATMQGSWCAADSSFSLTASSTAVLAGKQ